MSGVMMACGCSSQGQHSNAHDAFPGPHDSCLIHSCCVVAVSAPDLSQRRARCTYYGKKTGTTRQGIAGNECNYGQQREPTCTCEQPSSPKLPFFKYLGPESRTAVLQCVCGYYLEPHWPRYEARISVAREEASPFITTHEVFARTEDDAQDRAQAYAENYGKQRPEVLGATVLSVKRVGARAQVACGNFRPVGARPFDEFYCGCAGWD